MMKDRKFFVLKIISFDGSENLTVYKIFYYIHLKQYIYKKRCKND